MSDPARLVLAVLGGGLGAGLRVLVGLRVPASAHPWHTLGVNAAGSFALGVLAGWVGPRSGWYALLGAGACGGFTTFSAFSLEALALRDAGRPARAAAYVLGSVAAGLAASASSNSPRPQGLPRQSLELGVERPQLRDPALAGRPGA